MTNCKMIVNYKKHLFFRGEDYLKGMDQKPIFQYNNRIKNIVNPRLKNAKC